MAIKYDNSGRFEKGRVPWNKGGALTESHKRKIGEANSENPTRCWLGKKRPNLHSEAVRQKMSEDRKGKTPKNLILLHKLPRTEEWKTNISKSNKGKECPWLEGDNNHNWKGGISKLSPYRHYRNAEYIDWRKGVFERDNFTCQDCGARSGNGEQVVLHPHHKKSYTYFPLLRYEANNGLTLCVDCHHRAHGWRC